MRTDYLTLVDQFSDDYPHLVISMSGPWKEMRQGRLIEEDEPWICNFQNMSLGCRTVHSGSRGATMFEALRTAIDYLEANPDSAPDQSIQDRPANSPAP